MKRFSIRKNSWRTGWVLIAICVASIPWSARGVDLVVDPNANNAAAVAELIGAIRAARTAGLPAAISLFSNGVYTLTQPDNWEYGPNGLPQISSEITIDGRGATIQRSTNAPRFRFFYVSGGLSYEPITGAGLPAGNLTLVNLVLRGGWAKGGDSSGEGGGGGGMGGAVFNQGTLTLVGMTIIENKAQGGSGDLYV